MSRIGDKLLNMMKLDTDDDFDEDEFDDEPVIPKKVKKNVDLYNDDEDEEPVKVSRFKQPAEENKVFKTEQPIAKQKSFTKSTAKVVPMRTGNMGMEVCVIKPTSMEDSREIIDTLLSGRAVIINLEGLQMDIAQRILDFATGACYSINGNLQKITNYIFIITPENVDISGDFQDMIGGSFDIASFK